MRCDVELACEGVVSGMVRKIISPSGLVSGRVCPACEEAIEEERFPLEVED